MAGKIKELIQDEKGLKLPKYYEAETFPEAIATTTIRNQLLLGSVAIVAVPRSAEESNVCGNAARALQTYIKEVEDYSKKLRDPLNAAAKKIKSTSDEHLARCYAEKKRLEDLQRDWNIAEEARVEKEEADRAEQIRLAEEREAEAARIAEKTGSKTAEVRLEKATEQVNEAIAITAAPVQRAAGQPMKNVLKWEVVDQNLLFKSRPDLFTVEIKKSAVNAVCFPKNPKASAGTPDITSYPGLKVWYEREVSTKRF